jgi:hypothetical protein
MVSRDRVMDVLRWVGVVGLVEVVVGVGVVRGLVVVGVECVEAGTGARACSGEE